MPVSVIKYRFVAFLMHMTLFPRNPDYVEVFGEKASRKRAGERSSLVILRFAQDLSAALDRPFAEFTLSGANVLRACP
jgi:hypothetical protein